MVWRRAAHAAYDTAYHLVWSPKYRRDVLRGRVAERVAEMFREIGESYDITIDEMEVSPDHVHIFCSFPPRYSISQVVTRFKSLSARAVFREHPDRGEAVRAVLRPEADGSLFDSLLVADDEVWICWDPQVTQLNPAGEDGFQHGVLWNAQETFQWLTGELIPAVLDWRTSRTRRRLSLSALFGSREAEVPTMYYTESAGTHQLDVTNIASRESLIDAVSRMQSFYCTYTRRCVTTASMCGLYRCLLWCLVNSELDPGSLDYMKRKFGYLDSPESLRSLIDARIAKCTQLDVVFGDDVEWTLRALLVALRGGVERTSTHSTLSQAKDNLAELIAEFNTQSYLERHSQ